jgi:hypothetical protein
LQQPTSQPPGPEGSSKQTDEGTHVVGVQAIVTDERHQQTPAQISTITAEQQTQTGTSNRNQFLARRRGVLANHRQKTFQTIQAQAA